MLSLTDDSCNRFCKSCYKRKEENIKVIYKVIQKNKVKLMSAPKL